MIEDISASVEISGDKFSPELAEKRTGLSFIKKLVPGDIGKIGRYKNKPLPYGASSLEAPADVDSFDTIIWIANALKGKVQVLEECGADDIHFLIAFYYKDQCNCVLSAEELKAIAETGLDFHFSCYDISKNE